MFSRFKKIFSIFIVIYCFSLHTSFLFSYNTLTNKDPGYKVFKYLTSYLQLVSYGVDSKAYNVARAISPELSFQNVDLIIRYLEERIGTDDTKRVVKKGLSNLKNMNYSHLVNLANFYEKYIGKEGVDYRLRTSLSGFTTMVQLEGESSLQNIMNLLTTYLGEKDLKRRLLANLSFLEDIRYIDLYNFLNYLDSIGGKQYSIDILLTNLSLFNRATLPKLKSIIELLQKRGYLSDTKIAEKIKDNLGYLAETNSSKLEKVLDIYEKYLDKEFIVTEVLKNFSSVSEASKTKIEGNIDVYKKYTNYTGSKFNEIFKKYYVEFSTAIPEELEEVLYGLSSGVYNYFNQETIKVFLENNFSILVKARWNKLKEVLKIFERYYTKEDMYSMLNKPKALKYFITVDVQNFYDLTYFLFRFLGYQGMYGIIHSVEGVDFLYKMKSEVLEKIVRVLQGYWSETTVKNFIYYSYNEFLKINNIDVIEKNLDILYEVYNYNKVLKKDGLYIIFNQDKYINSEVLAMDIGLEEMIHYLSILVNEENFEIRNFVLENIDIFITILNSKNYKNFIINVDEVKNRNQKLSKNDLITMIRIDPKRFKILLKYLDISEITDSSDDYFDFATLSSEIEEVFSFFEKSFDDVVDKKVVFKSVNKYFKYIVNSDFKYLKSVIRSLLIINKDVVVNNLEFILNPSNLRYHYINENTESNVNNTNINTNTDVDPLKILSILKKYLKSEVKEFLKNNFKSLYISSKNLETNIVFIENSFTKDSSLLKEMIKNSFSILSNNNTYMLKEIFNSLSSIGVTEIKDTLKYLEVLSLLSTKGLLAIIEGIKSNNIDKNDLDRIVNNRDYINLFNDRDTNEAIDTLKKAALYSEIPSHYCRYVFID